MARDIVGLKINADLLDGLSASDFAQVSGSATFSGSVTATGLVVDDGGTIGSSTTTDAITIASNGITTLEGSATQAAKIQGSTQGNVVIKPNSVAGWSLSANTSGTFTLYDQALTRNVMQLDSSADVTLNNGNLVIGTSGKGIDFSATSDASGSTSELLDDYEEGTWTPTVNGDATGSFSEIYGHYTKIGTLVTIVGQFTVSANFTSSSIGGLPYNVRNTSVSGLFGLFPIRSNSTNLWGQINSNNNTFSVVSDLSGTLHTPSVGDATFRFCFTYQV